MIISTPYVWVELGIMEANIEQMAKGLKENNISHRPHIKTHKSIEIAKMQLAAGASGVTCATLSEAEVMINAGIKNVLIAYSLIGEDKFQRLAQLLPYADITVTVDSMQSAKDLSKVGIQAGKKIKALVEIMTQIRRGGIEIGSLLVEFSKKLICLEGISLEGIFCYCGVKPGIASFESARQFAEEERELMFSAKRLLEGNGITVKLMSGGSSVTSKFPQQLQGISESRCGNYVFNDMNAVHLGILSINDCALRVKSTVVSTPIPGQAIIDAGSKTLYSDTKKDRGYGYIVNHPEAKIYKLNEEHGFVKFNPQVDSLVIGDIVDIIPNHSCVLPNLCDYILAFRNGEYQRKIRVDARGMNY